MALTYTFIAKSVLSVSNNFNFTGIPSTYQDLVLKLVVRASDATNATDLYVNITGNNAGYNGVASYVSSSANGAFLQSRTDYWGPGVTSVLGSSATANTASSIDIYLPNYKGSTGKIFVATTGAVDTNNNTRQWLVTGYNTATAAISGLYIQPGGSWLAGSSAYLYGIS